MGALPAACDEQSAAVTMNFGGNVPFFLMPNAWGTVAAAVVVAVGVVVPGSPTVADILTMREKKMSR